MARRKSAQKRRSKKQPINLLAVSESLLLANAVTTAAFNCSLPTFIMGNKGFGFDGSSVMSLPELLGIGDKVAFGGNYGAGRTFQTQIVANIKANGVSMATQLIAIPIAFRIGGKVLSKPRRITNKMLKMSSLGVKV